MDYIQDYFVCDLCQNKDFRPIYNFSIRFHGVNFADELIYDKLSDELYQCTKCKKTFRREEIDGRLDQLKRTRRQKM